MLVELKLDNEKVKKWNKRVKKCIKKYKDTDETIASWIVDKDNMGSIIDLREECIVGFYGLKGNPFYLEDLTHYNVVRWENSFTPHTLEDLVTYEHIRNNYGVCDNYSQVLKEYPELENDKDRKFIVELRVIIKEENLGWRWFPHGKYIGELNPKCEYLKDEDDSIQKVICFYIYEVEEE